MFFIIVVAAWICSLIFRIIWEKQDKEFQSFLTENSGRLLAGEICEYGGRLYSLDTRLVRYSFCCSIIVMTFTRGSALRPLEDSITERIICILLTLFGGWWGIPWGPVHSIKSFIDNASPKTITVRELFS